MSDPISYSEDNLGRPELSAREVDLVRALEGQRLQYARAHFAGNGDAHINYGERANGLGKAMAIVWRWMTQPDARLDDGEMWPVSFAVTKLTAAVEARIVELVKKAAG